MKGRVVTVSAWYEPATPLFCAGADEADVRVRPASLRGVLRWWWRATRYAGLARDAGDPLAALAEAEADLFGTARPSQRQGRVSVRVHPMTLHVLHKESILRDSAARGAPVGPGVRYLGYGLLQGFGTKDGKKRGELLRACAQVDPRTRSCFRVDLVCRGLDDAQIATLEQAIDALGTCGGLGARSRRGWGSLALRARSRVEGWPQSPDETTEQASGPVRRSSLAELYQALAVLLELGTSGADFPPITAFGPKTRVVVVHHDGTPLEALDAVGREMVRYRSWGKNGRILGDEPAEQNFRDDHDLMKSTDPPTTHPRRAAFGLPQSYGSRLVVKPAGFDRRASPLLLHVHPLDTGTAVVCTCMPSIFLPGQAPKIEVGRSERKVALRPSDQLFHPLHELLDRLKANLGGHEVRQAGARPAEKP